MNKKEIEELLDPELISEAKERIARGEKISLRSDVGFKLFLSRNTPTSQYCLKSFLSAILGKPVDEATVINSEILPEYIQNKQCRLDINCVYNGMNRANLEMQVLKETDSEEKRAMYYASKLMSGSLRRGDKYGSIPIPA